MKQSNAYILAYTVAVTFFCALLLSAVTLGLKERQLENIEFERKSSILSTVMELKDDTDVKEVYAKRVRGYVVNYEGKVIEGVAPEKVDVAKEYKKSPESRYLPIYEIVSESDPNEVEYYVFPLYGYGLWDNIWGYVSLKADLNTIYGTNFAHKSETPGLGARIATEEIQKRFSGKKIFNQQGEFVSVEMQKGEGMDYSNDPHKVDGMSGATITGRGLNQMLKEYLGCYINFIKSKQNNLSFIERVALY
ncbi:MAG: NADH:ubiquinone reductase (Na(+)-transporting) subunit C [Cytophagales bacterium]|nr:NADH:ubiquinone reductase (Na(+)-transporting) subunit C [Cytophagales bacterium]MDW8385026.1 NADH:ubiquinone reductase (Na(+)-transporting) subunit C [Flammeovirgaceae bacterium]